MTWLNNCRISIKFVILICVVVMGLGVAGFSASRLARGALLEDRVQALKSVVEMAVTTADSLDRYLSRGHTLMPDFSLSSQERNALVAYILSLR